MATQLTGRFRVPLWRDLGRNLGLAGQGHSLNHQVWCREKWLWSTGQDRNVTQADPNWGKVLALWVCPCDYLESVGTRAACKLTAQHVPCAVDSLSCLRDIFSWNLKGWRWLLVLVFLPGAGMSVRLDRGRLYCTARLCKAHAEYRALTKLDCKTAILSSCRPRASLRCLYCSVVLPAVCSLYGTWPAQEATCCSPVQRSPLWQWS